MFRSILSKTEHSPETISVESIQECAVGLISESDLASC